MRQKQSRDWSRVESSEETRAETRAKETREQSAGRDGDASRNRDAKRKRENTSNDSQMLELGRRAFLYSESATAAVVLHGESDLHEHANGCRIGHTSSASSAAHLSSSCALLHKTRACDNTAYNKQWKILQKMQAEHGRTKVNK